MGVHPEGLDGVEDGGSTTSVSEVMDRVTRPFSRVQRVARAFARSEGRRTRYQYLFTTIFHATKRYIQKLKVLL